MVTTGLRPDFYPITAALDSALRYSPRPTAWQRFGLAAKKIVLLGDSTTVNATTLFSRLTTFSNQPGEALDGLPGASIVNGGSNGVSLAAWIAGSGSYTISQAISANADLYVLCYGINDVRLGLTSEDQLVALIKTVMNTLRAALPNADFVLRIPNALTQTNTGALNYVTDFGGAVNPAGAAQSYTDIMWNAHKRCEFLWSNVSVFDTQTAIPGVFGRTALAADPYMTDQLHPNAIGQSLLADALATFCGIKLPFSPGAAKHARAVDSASPWLTYPRAVEDPLYYDLIATGEYVGQGSGFLDFTWPAAATTSIFGGDLVQMGANAPFALLSTVNRTVNGASTRLSSLGTGNPIQTMTAGTVNVWRPKYGSSAIEDLMRQTAVYPYRRRGYVVGGGAGFIDIAALPGEKRDAANWTPSVTDILQVVGQSPLTLTGATFGANGLNQRILISGTYTSYATNNPQCVLVGSHAYEGPGVPVSVAVAPGLIAAASTADVDVTVTGVTVNDTVTVQPPAALEPGYVWSARVKAAGTVTLRIANVTAAGITGASLTWKFVVVR